MIIINQLKKLLLSDLGPRATPMPRCKLSYNAITGRSKWLRISRRLGFFQNHIRAHSPHLPKLPNQEKGRNGKLSLDSQIHGRLFMTRSLSLDWSSQRIFTLCFCWQPYQPPRRHSSPPEPLLPICGCKIQWLKCNNKVLSTSSLPDPKSQLHLLPLPSQERMVRVVLINSINLAPCSFQSGYSAKTHTLKKKQRERK